MQTQWSNWELQIRGIYSRVLKKWRRSYKCFYLIEYWLSIYNDVKNEIPVQHILNIKQMKCFYYIINRSGFDIFVDHLVYRSISCWSISYQAMFTMNIDAILTHFSIIFHWSKHASFFTAFKALKRSCCFR